MGKFSKDILDYDPSIQGQFESAASIAFPQAVVKDSALITWADIEESAGATVLERFAVACRILWELS